MTRARATKRVTKRHSLATFVVVVVVNQRYEKRATVAHETPILNAFEFEHQTAATAISWTVRRARAPRAKRVVVSAVSTHVERAKARGGNGKRARIACRSLCCRRRFS